MRILFEESNAATNFAKTNTPSLAWLSELRTVRYRAGNRHALHLCLSFITNLARLKWLRLRTKSPASNVVAISLIENFGDIVACEPVAAYIRKTNPNALILWFVRKPYRELVQYNPHIDDVLTVNCLTEWIWLARSKTFDSIIDLHLPQRICSDCKIPLPKVVDDSQVTFDNYFDFGGLLSALSRSAGLPDLSGAPKVYIPESVRRRVNVRGLPQSFVVFHCEPIEKCKRWSVEKWKELAEKTNSFCGVTVVEVGQNSVLSECGLDSYVNLCGQLELLETAEVIKRSSVFVGIDSGPAHFANALNVRGVVLLGHYHNFKRYLPYSGNYTDPSKCEIVYGDGPTATIEEERVFEAVQRQLRIASDLCVFAGAH